MSEASGREQLERRLVQRSLEDESFRQRLLEDPKAAVEQELGTRLPEDVRVVAVEETAQTIYLVLPSSSPLGGEGELSDGAFLPVSPPPSTAVRYGGSEAHVRATAVESPAELLVERLPAARYLACSRWLGWSHQCLARRPLRR
jgi:Nitrile hydratase, alpha chain